MFNPANNTHFSLEVGGMAGTGLQVLSFEGKETISKPYSFEVTLVNRNIRFDISQLLSKPAYLAFTPDGKSGVHGVIMSVRRGAVGRDYAEYSVTLTPRFSHLEKRTNQRIFQHKTAPQIISQILNEYGIVEGVQHDFRVQGCPVRDYCVQYDETDAYFIQRLCQEEGIHYHFQHSPDNHLMVFGDAQPIFQGLSKAIRYAPSSGLVADDPVIKAFNVNLTSKTKSVMWRDYNYTNTKIPEGQADGKQSANANGAQEPDVEFYAYPGHFMDGGRGKQLAQIEIERLRTEHVLAQGYSDTPLLHAGHYLTIEEHPSLDAKDPWLLNTVVHQGKQPQVVEALGGEKTATLPNSQLQSIDASFPEGEFHQGYRNSFTATPEDVTWRPPLNYPKSRIYGNQTAKVVGPKGEEIYCDEYGNVKVQFHWDREGSFDENSSCWVRVGSNWAHKSYGAVTIPRIDMEVLIAFLEGDPDQPVVIGCIHNGTNTLPYSLPDHKTRSVFKTNSSKGGGGYNELRIEDKKGEEEIYVQAEKDYNHLTKHDRTKTIGNDETNDIVRHRKTHVGGNHDEQVDGNQGIKIKKNQTEGIDKNKYLTVADNYEQKTGHDKKIKVVHDQSLEVGRDETIKIGRDEKVNISRDEKVNVGRHVSYVVGDSFEIICGKSKFTMNKSGKITITGSEIISKTTGAQYYKATGNIELKAKKIMEN